MKKLIIFTILSIFFTGCAVAPLIITPIVTGIVMWKEGESSKYYHEEPKTLYRATKLALKELDYSISKDETTKNGYYIVAGEEDKFKISIRQVKNHISEAKIRINLMGDKDYAELVYENIDLNIDTIDFDDQGKPTKTKKKF